MAHLAVIIAGSCGLCRVRPQPRSTVFNGSWFIEVEGTCWKSIGGKPCAFPTGLIVVPSASVPCRGQDRGEPAAQRFFRIGGEGGIRTHVPLTGQDAFE